MTGTNANLADADDVLYGTVTVTITLKSLGSTITVGNVEYNTADYCKSLRSHTVDIKVTPSGRARVFATNAADGDPTTAHTVESIAITGLINESTGAAVADAKVTQICYAYIYGGDHTEGGVVATSYRDDNSVAAQGLRVDLKDHTESWA